MHAPTSAAMITATCGSATKMAIASMVSALMELTPIASPSSPSIRFTAFVSPTIQITVMGIDSHPKFQ